MKVDSIDVFITYRCGLRCEHCFVGDNLASNKDYDFALFALLLKHATRWNTREITFLGGEPTLYPRIHDAVRLTLDSGFAPRIVTNGHTSYSRFLRDFKGPHFPSVCFSLDGASAETHDAIRGKGSFAELRRNALITREKSAGIAGILSISRSNIHDVERMLPLCDEMGFDYVNVHHVSNRGFASKESVLTLREWQEVCRLIDDLARKIETKVRLERTFVPRARYRPNCAVAERSNLMFLPDGRVFMCMMFIDLAGAHSFTWTSQGLQPNTSTDNEARITSEGAASGCPAMRYVNPDLADEAESLDHKVCCIYYKDELQKTS